MRRSLVAGNAKMNLTRTGLLSVLDALKRDIALNPPTCDVVYCPPFVWLTDAAAALSGSRIGLGAQNMHWEASGAFTGEIAPGMLREAGCRYVILGHSERRQLFGETDAGVNLKVAAALGAQLVPIICVGETLEQREAGRTLEVVSAQVAGCLQGRCHYIQGNLYARKRVDYLGELMKEIGLEAARLRMINISAAMGVQFAQFAGEHVETVRALGPSPLRREKKGAPA